MKFLEKFRVKMEFLEIFGLKMEFVLEIFVVKNGISTKFGVNWEFWIKFEGQNGISEQIGIETEFLENI